MNYLILRASLFQILVFFFFVLLVSGCNPEAESVTVKILNGSAHEPIAVRMTDKYWVIIQPGNTYTYEEVTPFSQKLLLGFTIHDNSTSWRKLENCLSYYSRRSWEREPCYDDDISPPYSSLKSFEFSTERRKKDSHISIRAVASDSYVTTRSGSEFRPEIEFSVIK